MSKPDLSLLPNSINGDGCWNKISIWMCATAVSKLEHGCSKTFWNTKLDLLRSGKYYPHAVFARDTCGLRSFVPHVSLVALVIKTHIEDQDKSETFWTSMWGTLSKKDAKQANVAWNDFSHDHQTTKVRGRQVRTPENNFKEPLLVVLLESPDCYDSDMAVDMTGQLMRLNKIDLETLKSGQIRWRNTVQWMRNALANAGIILRGKRGIWKLSEYGISIARQAYYRREVVALNYDKNKYDILFDQDNWRPFPKTYRNLG